MLFIITRGFLVSALQTVTMITYVVNPQALHWAGTHFCLSRVYVITMLAMSVDLWNSLCFFLNSTSPLDLNTDVDIIQT
jgi:hypothetical protein